MVDPVPLWTWTVTLSLAIAAAVAVARTRPGRLATLSAYHVAGAAVLATLAWQLGIGIPSAIMAFFTSLGGPQEPGPHLIPMGVLQLTYVTAAAVAVTFVLRRHLWAVVLGIGLSIVHVSGLAASWASWFESAPVELSIHQALLAVPPLVAIALFVRPLVAARQRPAEGPAQGANAVG